MTASDVQLGHIFLVEDDESLASLVKEYFELQGFSVSTESRGDLATQHILAVNPDAVILDLMLPGMNGLDVCRQLRSHSDVPVLMLTARTDEIDQIVGLEVGADDYICKPVQPRLLLARVNAILRRTQKEEATSSASAQEIVQFGQLEINKSKRDVVLAGEQIELTTSEMELLCQFVNHADEVLTRDQLLNNLRGFGYDGLDRTIDMLVSRLRKKLLDNASKPFRIKTVWKKGYLFVSDAWD